MVQAINVHLGKRLRRRRRMLGMTQGDLATTLGLRFQQIHKYECAANSMSAARLWELAKALDVPVSYFFDGLHRAADRLPEGASVGRDETFAGDEP